MTPRLHPPESRLLDHVTGGGDAAAQALMECHLAMCDVCAARVADLSLPGGAFLAHQSPLAAPPDLFDRVLARIDHEPPIPASIPFATILAPYLPRDLVKAWRGVLCPGFRFLDLALEPAQSLGFYLAHMEAGRPFPNHSHGGLEEAVVLAGGLEDGGERLEAGDWSTRMGGTRHAPRALEGEDCWLVVRTEDEIWFSGWRGMLQRLV